MDHLDSLSSGRICANGAVFCGQRLPHVVPGHSHQSAAPASTTRRTSMRKMTTNSRLGQRTADRVPLRHAHTFCKCNAQKFTRPTHVHYMYAFLYLVEDGIMHYSTTRENRVAKLGHRPLQILLLRQPLTQNAQLLHNRATFVKHFKSPFPAMHAPGTVSKTSWEYCFRTRSFCSCVLPL